MVGAVREKSILERRRIVWFILVVVFCSHEIKITVSESNKIRSLPGFHGHLPFDLETGYIGIDGEDGHSIELFYYFVKSESNPKEDPLLLWIDGGPGCSALCGLAFEIGPLYFRIAEYNGSLPTLKLNPNSWTKVSNVIFLDAPVGTGFSFSRTEEGYHTSDTKSALQTFAFLREWLIQHPEFLNHPLYISGLSYCGFSIPQIAQAISDGNDAGNIPFINMKGYVLGNGGTDRHIEVNSQVPFAHGMGLISDELYESVKKSCSGEYVNVDPSNTKCVNDLEAVQKCTSSLNNYHILEPACATEAIEPRRKRKAAAIEAYPTLELKSKEETYDRDSSGKQRIEEILEEPENAPHTFEAHYVTEEIWKERSPIDEYSSEVPISPPLPPNPVHECRTYGYRLAYYWANDARVQEALHVQKGSIDEWIRCKLDIPYKKELKDVVGHHLKLSSKGYRSLIYNGDHDMTVPFLGTQEWIKSLNFSIVDDWRPWYVGGYVSGYTRTYANNLTFATIKGGGHEVPMYKPKECFAMFKRWISHNPL